MEFVKFNKIPRLNRECTISEKIDGSNVQVFIYNKEYDFLFPNTDISNIVTNDFISQYALAEKDELLIFAGSRTRWLTTEKNGDNHGFAKWVKENAEELFKLGEGRTYGEWYGKNVNRNYGLTENKFALFNVGKWHKYGDEKRLISIDPETNEEKYTEEAPKCCGVVPILYEGKFSTEKVQEVLNNLKLNGSVIVPKFMKPEGIIIFHEASGKLFKVTCENDEKPKGIPNAE